MDRGQRRIDPPRKPAGTGNAGDHSVCRLPAFGTASTGNGSRPQGGELEKMAVCDRPAPERIAQLTRRESEYVGKGKRMLPATSDIKIRRPSTPECLVVDDEPGTDRTHRRGRQGRRWTARSSSPPRLLEARKILSSATGRSAGHRRSSSRRRRHVALCATLREHQPNASAIVITGSPSMDRAITAIRGGAIDFVTKPFSNRATHRSRPQRHRTPFTERKSATSASIACAKPSNGSTTRASSSARKSTCSAMT